MNYVIAIGYFSFVVFFFYCWFKNAMLLRKMDQATPKTTWTFLGILRITALFIPVGSFILAFVKN